eukprot:UN05313
MAFSFNFQLYNTAPKYVTWGYQFTIDDETGKETSCTSRYVSETQCLFTSIYKLISNTHHGFPLFGVNYK